jgi:hypothetical protein
MTAFGQTFKNGNFESWSEITVERPGGWESTLGEFFRSGQTPPSGIITKVTGQMGSAIQLETKIVNNDTLFGFFSNADDPIEGVGGEPFTEQPDSITGYYKYDVKSGDTALLLVVFKKNAAIINTDIFKITGTQSNFTRFAFPLTLSSAPDTIIVAAASSNAIDEVGIQAGSTITFDNLAFSGATQNVSNNDFETWQSDTLRSLNDGWTGFGTLLSRTSDAAKGNYAVVLETNNFGNNSIVGGILSNGRMNQNGPPLGGMPYNGSDDTVVFSYKYEPSGQDTAQMAIFFFNNGTVLGQPVGQFLLPSSNYVEMEVPFQVASVPDTIGIIFISSANPAQPSDVGSKLYIDELRLKSEILNTGIKDIIKTTSVSVYPNPVTNNVSISFNAQASIKAYIQITDVLGKTITQKPISIHKGGNNFTTVTQNLSSGIYFYNITSETNTVLISKKFTKE